MSLVAEVTPEIVKSAGKVAAAVEVRNILLVEGTAALSRQFVEKGSKYSEKAWSVRVTHTGKHRIHDGNMLRTLTHFTFTAKESERSKSKPLLIITAIFVAEYEMAEGFRPSKHDLEAFVRANAVFNCWPYWREYVHSTAARMNLPPQLSRSLGSEPPRSRIKFLTPYQFHTNLNHRNQENSDGKDTGRR